MAWLEVHEDAHMGRPDLRVRGETFATLPPDDTTVNLKTTPANLDALVTDDPDTFTAVWGTRWVRVDLSRVPPELLREPIEEACSLAARRRFVATNRGAGA